MRNKIITKLKDIEKENNVKILYAVESGSRAWGFESKDSDYDIRFIYVHPLDWYISIEEKSDVIEPPIGEELDFSGWDIKKALQLYKKSNPPLYEWLISPIVYMENGDFARKLRDLTQQFYSPVSSMHHYLHMAQGNYKDYLKKDLVRTKKYFYVLRPILACMWIEKYKTQPPVEFIKTIEALDLKDQVKVEIESLYKRKKVGEELDKEKRIPVLNNFLEEKIKYFENYLQEARFSRNKRADGTMLDVMLYEFLTNV